jgi:uncharacterized protein
MLDPGSAILATLYRQQPDEAQRLADAAPALTIFEAAALGRDPAAAALLDADPSLVNGWAADGHVPVALAAFFGHPSTVVLLLERGADVHATARNSMMVQPLHAAVAGRSAEAVAALLDRGADPNARQQAGYTPLMGAAAAGRDDLADLLLAGGADPSLLSEDGKTAAAIASEHGHAALAKKLDPGS